MFRNNLAFSATGSEYKSLKAKLGVFHGAPRRYGIETKAAPNDWLDAFYRLRGLLESDTVIRNENGRRVVFLDEFPWFATRRPSFLTAFTDFWNSWASKQSDIALYELLGDFGHERRLAAAADAGKEKDLLSHPGSQVRPLETTSA